MTGAQLLAKVRELATICSLQAGQIADLQERMVLLESRKKPGPKPRRVETMPQSEENTDEIQRRSVTEHH